MKAVVSFHCNLTACVQTPSKPLRSAWKKGDNEPAREEGEGGGELQKRQKVIRISGPQLRSFVLNQSK